MPVSRRGFLHLAARGVPASAAVLAARGLGAPLAAALVQEKGSRPRVPPGVREIRINNNENPLGPGKAALEAMAGKFPEAGRYPFNSTPADSDLVAAIAAKYKVKPENVVLGAGSQELLRNAVRAFTGPGRHLLTALPTFENCTNVAKLLAHPLVEIGVDSSFRLDLAQMVARSRGAGLVFLNNPNNPTGTVHGGGAVAGFVERVRQVSPGTVILIDEAYHDYVTEPSYQSAIPIALDTPNVVVTRTFSKAHGMAGMRVGYAIGRPGTIGELARFRMPYGNSVFSVAGAIASLNDPRHIEEERARNTEVRAFTVQALEAMGCKVADSQTNFVFFETGRPAKDFREACAKLGLVVARDFPPFEKTHARISIGTMDEMQRATEVIRTVLGAVTSTAGGRA